MELKTTEILGIKFRIIGDILMSMDGALSIINTSENEQFFMFKNCAQGDFSELFVKYTIPELFEKYNCTNFSIENMGSEDVINLDRIGFPEKIKRITINSSESANFIFSDRDSYFENLEFMTLKGEKPKKFPNCFNVKTITNIATEGNVDRLNEWFDVSVIRSMSIDSFSENDFSSLKEFKSLEMLQLWNRPKMRSLDGLENLPKLRVLDIAYPTKLTDVSAILRTKNLKNIKFDKFKKIKNWDFLVDKKNIESLVIDTAESTEFVKKLPNLKYFFCEKALDRNNKPVYYVPESMADITPQSAFKDGWPYTKAFQLVAPE